MDSWRKTENAAELLDEKTILLEDEDDRTVLLLEEPIGRLVPKNPEQKEIVLDDDGFVIGRSTQGTDHQLEGTGISRRHIRFYKEDGHIRLQPENDNMDPIIVPDCEILGRVHSLYRPHVV